MTSDMKARFMEEEILNLTIKKKEFFILRRDFPWFHIVHCSLIRFTRSLTHLLPSSWESDYVYELNASKSYSFGPLCTVLCSVESSSESLARSCARNSDQTTMEENYQNVTSKQSECSEQTITINVDVTSKQRWKFRGSNKDEMKLFIDVSKKGSKSSVI